MDQTFTSDDRAITFPDEGMSFEELAEERWEKASTWGSKRTAPVELAEDELPF